MRGEYNNGEAWGTLKWELPPRARRIHHRNQECCLLGGTTSACAENTPRGRTRRPNGGNYLRVRGEYLSNNISSKPAKELPPRARRIPVSLMPLPLPSGTTSACAENTSGDSTGSGTPGNYLRVRGEYPGLDAAISWAWELPPRARRIRGPSDTDHQPPGTTSACAENTGVLGSLGAVTGNYLRVRGEYPSSVPSPIPSPGTTSACAENTGKPDAG